MLKQIGVVTSTYGHYTLEYALSSIAAAGFCNAELWAASPGAAATPRGNCRPAEAERSVYAGALSGADE